MEQENKIVLINWLDEERLNKKEDGYWKNHNEQPIRICKPYYDENEPMIMSMNYDMLEAQIM